MCEAEFIAGLQKRICDLEYDIYYLGVYIATRLNGAKLLYPLPQTEEVRILAQDVERLFKEKEEAQSSKDCASREIAD